MKRPTNENTLTPEQFSAALLALGWTQAEFARKTGMSAAAVGRWALGQTETPLWATSYLGMALDLMALHTKYLAPTAPAPDRLAHLIGNSASE